MDSIFDNPLFWFDINLRQLARHLEAVETLLEKEAAATSARIDEYAKTIANEDDRDEYYAHVSDEYQELEELFPQMQRQASLIAVMSVAEIELNKLCDHVATKTKQRLKVVDLNGRGIRRAESYLSKVSGVKKAWESPAWLEIKRASEIRNVLVHNEGVIEKPEIISYVGTSQHLSKHIHSGALELKKTYVSHVLAQFDILYRLVFKELEDGGAAGG